LVVVGGAGGGADFARVVGGMVVLVVKGCGAVVVEVVVAGCRITSAIG
jgi:hypothetical protein